MSRVQITGSKRVLPEAVASELGLAIGGPITIAGVNEACSKLRKLRISDSTRCRYKITGKTLSLTFVLDDDVLPCVFNNFVWLKKPEILSRLKQEIPLFSERLPIDSGLNDRIIQVLQKMVDEQGIKGQVRYDDHWGIERGWNIFYVEGLDTPIECFEVKERSTLDGANIMSIRGPAWRGRDLPQLLKWLQTRKFSASFLEWWVEWILDSYRSTGYLRAQAKPAVEFLGPRNGTYPVRIVVAVRPGICYSLGSVRVTGLPEKTTAEVLQQWKHKPGEDFDYSALYAFVEGIVQPATVRAKRGRRVIACGSLDDERKAIDITLTPTWSKVYTFPKDDDDHTQCFDTIVIKLSPSP
ncbi:MAG: hypothetical protein ABSH01_09160 [Terriglobia bacterium]